LWYGCWITPFSSKNVHCAIVQLACDVRVMRRHVGMHDEQRVRALGPVHLLELCRTPGRRQTCDLHPVAEDQHLAAAQRQQIGLFGVELERDQTRLPRQTRDARETRAPLDAARGQNHDVAQAPRAVFVGAQIDATQHGGSDFARREACLGETHDAHRRASTSEKSSKLCGVSCWASISRARRNSFSASR
jgi:hypothetical protein